MTNRLRGVGSVLRGFSVTAVGELTNDRSIDASFFSYLSMRFAIGVYSDTLLLKSQIFVTKTTKSVSCVVGFL